MPKFLFPSFPSFTKSTKSDKEKPNSDIACEKVIRPCFFKFLVSVIFTLPKVTNLICIAAFTFFTVVINLRRNSVTFSFYVEFASLTRHFQFLFFCCSFSKLCHFPTPYNLKTLTWYSFFVTFSEKSLASSFVNLICPSLENTWISFSFSSELRLLTSR